MTERINGRPLWRLVFDAEGDVDAATLSALRDGIAAEALTDLVLFSHGWNNDEGAAQSLYARWFALLADQLDPGRTVGFVGIRWPSQLWRDEPIPDFDTAPAPRSGGGAAGLDGPALIEAEPVTIDPAELADLKDMFPDGSAQLDAIAALLEKPPTAQRAQRMFDELRQFSTATAAGCDDGERDAPAPVPGMLDTQREPVDVFNRFADRLADAGVRFDDGGGGAAGLGDLGSRIWHGAKEVLRQLSYWKMKNRAGVVGRNGLGPAIDDLVAARPDLRIHLVGHSFGARLVSFALDGITERSPSPVKSVTLLQGAFSRFTFTKGLPFRDGDGALVGRLARIDGPMAVCFSSHDRALGTFYPLASLTARDDAAGLDDPMARWRAMGALGAFRCDTQSLGEVGAEYPFAPGQILNLDSSEVVVADAGPSGAHSDIFHSELSWVAAAAGKLLSG
ncbi:lipase family protein [Mycobacterium sp. TNTM28]|uniref:Lipase family protein n=1 Tax=[Mycobacterium] fortunisiensis TaxID=2600579 RepID=A0ABS6KPM7_9MYCO|nr:lipase family protein [[Mycobacterium] fortunisiensis]MBU9765511.1 lipase family protein [[Mycobacterium] fortunisiensis]